MNRLTENGDGVIVPCLHIPISEEFDVCWAGPSPLGGGLCFGSTDGMILFADEEGLPLPTIKPGKGSVAMEAINGLVRVGTWVVVSTRADMNFWPLPGTEGGNDKGWAAQYGAHGVGTTPGGHVIAPLGRNGIMVIEPPFRPETPPTALGDTREALYIYRVIGLRSHAGTEVIACAARTAGIAAGEFSGPQTTHKMKTAAFEGLDVIDVCRLDSEGKSLAVAALSRDGSVILFRDVLATEKPLTMKFKKVQGTAYRVLSHRGELYVLTSRGVYVLGKLAARFLADQLHDGVVTQILTMPMDAVDANLAGHWLLVVMPDEVRRFDADWIHDNLSADGESQESQDFQSAVISQDWRWIDINQTARPLPVACEALKDYPAATAFYTDALRWNSGALLASLESSSLPSRNVNLDLAAKIALNMVKRGIELAQAGHADQALAALDEVVTRFHDRSESAIAELVVMALWNKGVQLRRLGRIEENLATCDSLISRFQDRPETSIASYVAMALLTKGVFLGRLGRREEAVAVFDTLVSKFENRPEVRITECVAGALVNKGHELEVRITECVAGALVNKGHELGELGRGDEALTVFDTVVSRYRNRPEVDILAQVASALVTKGYRLGKLRRAEEELATYDMLEVEFQGRTEAAIVEQVAKSCFNRAFKLGQLGRVMEELAIYDALALRFGERVEAGIAEWVAAARLNKAFRLWGLGRDAEALEVYDAVIRLQYSPEPSVISERVASALYSKGVTLCRLGDLMNAHESLAEVITRYQGNDKPGVVEVLARATQALEWIRAQGETREPWNSSDPWTQPMMNVPRDVPRDSLGLGSMSAMDFAA
jgi:tetratricopeptide (TPR) repeat protein